MGNNNIEQAPPEETEKNIKNTKKQKTLIIVLFGFAVLVFAIYIFSQLMGLAKKGNHQETPIIKKQAQTKKVNKNLKNYLLSFRQKIQKRNIAIAKIEAKHKIKEINKQKEKIKLKKAKLNSKMTVFIYKKKLPKFLKTSLTEKTKRNIISYFNGIPPGTTAYAELATAVFSFNTKAPAKAKLLQNIYTKEHKLVMPAGTIFLGTVSTIHSQDRVNIAFSQAVYPNGETYNINALALSNNGSAGIKGQVNSPALVDTLEGVGEAVLGLGSLFFGGNNSNPYSMNDQLKYAAGSSLTNQAGNSLANAQANNKTTITVKAGKTIKLIFLNGFNK
jgi:hypothetical protein